MRVDSGLRFRKRMLKSKFGGCVRPTDIECGDCGCDKKPCKHCDTNCCYFVKLELKVE